MSPDERNLLTRFLGDLNAIKGVRKEPEAAAQITQALDANPDASYLLVQHAILADQALATAQARISELESEVRRLHQAATDQGSSNKNGGFLGGMFGQRAPEPAPPPRRGPWGGPQPYSVVPQTYSQGGGGFFGGGAPAQPGGMGSFLANAGATAAGVAGGAFLFQGLSNLFGGHHGGGQGFLGSDVGQQDFSQGAGGGYGGAFDPGFSDGQGFADASSLGGSDDPVSYDSDNGDSGGDDYS